MSEVPPGAESGSGSDKEPDNPEQQFVGNLYKDSSDGERELFKKGGRSGCFVLALIIMAAVGGGAVMYANGSDENDNPCSGSRTLDGAPVQLIAVVGGGKCDSDDATTTTEAEASDGGGSAGAGAPPPAESELPPGSILFEGSSGDNIGYIYQDGATRYLAIDANGVAVGDAAGTSVAKAIGQAGKVVSFGATLNVADNPGRYGIALFRNVPASTSPYLAGCTMEIGQSSCQADTEGAPVKAGDKVTISIGEAGNAPARGDYTLDWWFVFQPDG